MRQKQMKYIFNKHNILVLVFFLFAGVLSAQQPEEESALSINDTTAQVKSMRVSLVRSDSTVFDKNRMPGVRIIYGNVIFRHDSTYMYCDSAYYYSEQSSFDAFGNVHIKESDSLNIYGDKLLYNGNTKLARLRNNVRMETNTTLLTTDSLNYNRATDLAYYYTGGTLKDEENTLTSIWGQYSSGTKEAVFKNSVNLTNKSFVLTTDSLCYNTENHIATIVDQTHILSEDTTNIYTRSGWYDTENERTMLLERSQIFRPDGKQMVGDTLFYDKGKQMVEAFSRVEMKDTVNKATVLADYVLYDEKKDSGLACDSLLLIDWSSPDSLFVHADSLYIQQDSTFKVMRALQNVRFYRNDIQGACDSLIYLERDSVATLYGQPVVWANESQLSGSIIQAFIKDSAINYFFVPEKALVVQKVDNIFYNQLAGKEMKAYVKGEALSLVELKGSCQSIYCPVDEKDSLIITVNKTESGFVNIYFTKEQTIDRVVLFGTPSGNAYPITEVSGDDRFLNGFFWIDEQRPKKWSDVFLNYPSNRHASSVVHIPSAASSSDDDDDSKKKNTTNRRSGNDNRAVMPSNLQD